jgi:putative glutamine amidotransferase
MKRKLLVGLNADYQSPRAGKPAITYLSAGYADAISRSGAIPIILPIVESRSDRARLLDLVDGMVMVGGADLDPGRDGFMRHPSVRALDPRREDFDRALVAMIVERQMPVLGIGVGCNSSTSRSAAISSFICPKTCPGLCPTAIRQTLLTATRWRLSLAP